ncbi:MAG: hypothetical protein J3K34DRAFT_142183 [Monoraphidium minutum]|nr:MAG: hypothetical protein J3K34DRAFT_142183 [Monoraphidium minutum]
MCQSPTRQTQTHNSQHAAGRRRADLPRSPRAVGRALGGRKGRGGLARAGLGVEQSSSSGARGGMQNCVCTKHAKEQCRERAVRARGLAALERRRKIASQHMSHHSAQRSAAHTPTHHILTKKLKEASPSNARIPSRQLQRRRAHAGGTPGVERSGGAPSTAGRARKWRAPAADRRARPARIKRHANGGAAPRGPAARRGRDAGAGRFL